MRQSNNQFRLFVRSGRSEQSVLKWNARVLRTGSGQNDPAHGSEPLNSPAPVGQSAGMGDLWREYVHARLGPFHINWPEPVLFGRPERTNGKRPKTVISPNTTFNFFHLKIYIWN